MVLLVAVAVEQKVLVLILVHLEGTVLSVKLFSLNFNTGQLLKCSKPQEHETVLQHFQNSLQVVEDEDH